MQKLFNKILVPVDYSEKSRKAVEKGVELAREYECSLHLVHVISHSPLAFWSYDEPFAMAMSAEQEERLQQSAHRRLLAFVSPVDMDKVRVEFSIVRGTWNEAIIEFINVVNIDLVLVGQENRLFKRKELLLNPNRIALRTNIPVITIPANRRIVQLYSIVIPVTDFLPVRKLIYGIYMGSKYTTTVKLLGVENEQTSEKVRYYLKKAYQLVRDNCNLNVELQIMSSNNVAEAVNQFAMTESADLVIVNPGNQSRMPGMFSAVFGKMLQRYSVPPVLTINPV